MSDLYSSDEQIKAIKAAVEKAGFGRLYSYEVRHSSGITDWDLSTCETDDPETPDCESIARVYNLRDVPYFVEVTPERVSALVAEVEQLRSTKTALLNVMQHIYELSHLMPFDDGLGENDVRERLESIEKWTQRFEGIGNARVDADDDMG